MFIPLHIQLNLMQHVNSLAVKALRSEHRQAVTELIMWYLLLYICLLIVVMTVLYQSVFFNHPCLPILPAEFT